LFNLKKCRDGVHAGLVEVAGEDGDVPGAGRSDLQQSSDLLTPGVDVMITIFGDFRQFLAKNGLFPIKTML
jgi:hypothetical protein